MSDDKNPPGLTIGVIGTGAGNARFLEDLAGVEHKPPEIIDPIEKAPDVSGPHGRAWHCDLEEGRRIMGPQESDATVAMWLIEAPWAHPIWHSYALMVIHLRPLPGQQEETIFYMDGATHELWLYALQPDTSRHEFLTTAMHPPVMTPMNFGAQFVEMTDDLACERIKGTIQMVCDGKLSPDTDHTRAWRTLFGGNMIKSEFK